MTMPLKTRNNSWKNSILKLLGFQETTEQRIFVNDAKKENYGLNLTGDALSETGFGKMEFPVPILPGFYMGLTHATRNRNNMHL